MLEFAGNKYVYLPKLKKDKIKKIRLSESQNEAEAPIINIQNAPKKMEVEDDNISKKLNKYGNQNMNQNKNDKDKDNISDSSDDAYLSVNFKDFNIDLEKSNINPLAMSNSNPAPNINFKKAIDTNACVVRYKALSNKGEEVQNLNKCSKCQAYLNKYSILKKENSGNNYEWTCEFCSTLNKNIIIQNFDMPKNDVYDYCLDKDKKVNISDEDSSLIFCFDISGSMCQSYYIEENLKKKFNKIFNKENKKTPSLFDNYENVTDFSNFDFNINNTNYVSRLDLVKLSIENNIKTLLEHSPNVKVGLVSFGSDIEVKGDCLSNVMRIKEKDMNNENKIKSLGEENTNLIKNSINKSSPSIIKSLREIEEEGSTALGPAVLLSLSLLKNAKIGSRIFLCTDGMSNLGIGSIEENKEKAAEFYTNIGNMAKEKGIVISLITFDDSESEIIILKNMVELSGGEIIRVNPTQILEGFNDLLENDVIASNVEVKLNLNKCLTFRDEEKINLKNDGSTYFKKVGNAARETETYHEFKFKSSSKLAEFSEINFDALKNLTFQAEINYKRPDGKRYIRVITKNLIVSDNKEEVNKQANMNIISTLQSRKSAFHQFNSNMNSFHNNMNMMNSSPMMMPMNNMNTNNNLFRNNNMNNMNNNLFSNNNMNRAPLFGNNMNMNMNNTDMLQAQIFQISNQSENRNNMFYQRNQLFK